jgi:S1-C subfamily serine protease
VWVTIGSGEGEGLSVRVEGERFVVGSGEECQLRVPDPQVAALHAYFQVRPDGVVELHDLGSPGGTFVDGRRIPGAVQVKGGEEIRVGGTVLRPSVEEPAEEARHVQSEGGHGDEAAVVVKQEGQTVEVVPDDPSTPDVDESAVRVRTEGEAVEVVPAPERRRAARLARRATIIAAAAAAVAGIAVALVLVLSGDDQVETQDVVAAVRDSTVLVAVEGRERGVGGSGFVLDAGEGLVVTNFHVVNAGEEYAVGVGDQLRPAALLAAAPCDDIAVLKVDDTDGMKTAKLGSQEDVEQGEGVVAVGYPASASLDDDLSSTAGVVSVVESQFRFPSPDSPSFPNVIQTDAALNPGNSGGPLVSREKKVVGVNTAIVTVARGAPGQGYALGIDRVKQVVEGLREGRSQGWAGFGIQVPKERELRSRDLPPGVFASSVLQGSPAARAGMQPGSLIVEINGSRLDASATSYCDAVRSVESGHTAVLGVLEPPGGRARQLNVRFP